MRDPDKILIEEQLKNLDKKVPTTEHFVEGSAVGHAGSGLIPCVIEGKTGSSLSVKLADGPDTGCTFDVEEKFVKAFGKEFYDDASRRLFR